MVYSRDVKDVMVDGHCQMYRNFDVLEAVFAQCGVLLAINKESLYVDSFSSGLNSHDPRTHHLAHNNISLSDYC